jgi:hypothetical protein
MAVSGWQRNENVATKRLLNRTQKPSSSSEIAPNRHPLPAIRQPPTPFPLSPKSPSPSPLNPLPPFPLNPLPPFPHPR